MCHIVGEFPMDSKPVIFDISSDEEVTTTVKSSVKDLDDDCVVLDGDPLKPVVVENNDAAADESDDLFILGEKGQIACRDYPHPRHLCAKFPFTSTPHEVHCCLCHCYVCDSHAPCVHWGTGISSIDHCHATDKDESWTNERRLFKKVDAAQTPVLKLLDISISVGPPEENKFPPHQTPIIRSCSTSTKSISRIQGICQRSGYVVPRNKFSIPARSISQNLRSSRSNLIRKKRKHNVGSLSTHFCSSGTIYKRTAPLGIGLGINRSGYGSSHTNYGSHYSRNSSPVLPSSRKNNTFK